MYTMKIISFFREYLKFNKDNKIQNAAAALSYYLTMTLFPTLIVLYTLLGDNYMRMRRLLGYMEDFLPEKIYYSLYDFLGYVTVNHSDAMLWAGIILLLTAASAAVRSIQIAINDMLDVERVNTLLDTFISVVYAVILLAAVYFAVLAMFVGENILTRLMSFIPLGNFIESWLSSRFLILAILLFLFLYGLFYASRRRWMKYNVLYGALLGTAGIVFVSYFYSLMLDDSVKYSVVYGSLTSVILLMVWLYTICLVIYAAAAFNIFFDKYKKGQEL